jgi:hypothetical protein
MSSEEFTKEDWERINNYAVANSDAILESAEHPHFAKRNLLVAGAANLALIAAWILYPRIMLWLFPGEPEVLYEFAVVYVFLILGTFACGFIFAYSACKLYRLYSGDSAATKIDSGLMSGFSYADNRDRNWKIWIISAAAGVVNLLLVRILVNVVGQPLVDLFGKLI